jgi:hypothetical protein
VSQSVSEKANTGRSPKNCVKKKGEPPKNKKAIEPQQYCLTKLNFKNQIQMSEKNNSNIFGIRTLELTIKVKKISYFVKRVINEAVHSI